MSDNQVALSRMTRAAPSSLSKATRQAVPPFLQKLYEMVSDSATDNLIRWSENGDSFFVLDHERVAHDVLPRWFKHSNFASFVRQLNMYGFHKIPHLQQGVLRSDTETEIWNFEHPNFRRGQPDLLCLITRKKQAQERQGEDVPMLEREGVPAGLPPAAAGLNPGSLVDINSIINGIAAIKRHQSTISADLNDLKTSNQHLWQEALEARERHQKQQDTINRILKFLAGVFGNATAHKTSPGRTSPHVGIPRKRQRLMIEGNAEPDEERPLEPLDGDEPMNESDESTQSNRFVEVSPSPAPAKSPTPAPVPAPAAPGAQPPAAQFPSQPSTTADIVMGGNFANQTPFIPFRTNAMPGSDNPGIPSSYPHTTDPSNTTALTSTGSASQELLQSIVNSPGSLQRLLNMLNLQQQQQNIPMPPPLDLNANASNSDESNGFSNGGFDPYSQFQQSSDPTLSVPENFDIVEPDSQTMSLLHSDEMPSINFEPFIENANKLKKTSDASSVITDHVNMMDSNIESLCKHLGLDPFQFEAMHEDGTFSGEAEDDALFAHDQVDSLPNPSDSTVPNPSVGLEPNPGGQSFQPTIPDFDFNAFINELSRQHNGNTGGTEFGDFNPVEHENLEEKQPDASTSPKLSAFVDEVASQSGQSDASSPSTSRATNQDDPDATPTAVASPEREKKTRKRKSDVEPPNGERIQVKSKRKR